MRVLVAEDDPDYRRVLESTLNSWGYDVVLAPDGTTASRILEAEDAPNLVLLDWVMPGLFGNQICRMVRERPRAKYTYLLLLSAKNRQADLVQGLEAGADDYLFKPFEPPELKARLRTWRRLLELQDELIGTREALRVQATHDVLTGIWNRRAILDILERELDRSVREQRPLGVLMIDLDHFKMVNDAHGHLAGDSVLREAARTMGMAMRPYDTLGRYGGEEFLVVLPGCDAANAGKFADRLRERVAQAEIAHENKIIPVTMSVGVAANGDPRWFPPAPLLQLADDALYRAKSGGRNRIEIAAIPAGEQA